MHFQQYKSFVQPHLDYGNIVYDPTNNQSFSNKIDAVQYNTVISVTNGIQELLEQNSIKNKELTR